MDAMRGEMDVASHVHKWTLDLYKCLFPIPTAVGPVYAEYIPPSILLIYQFTSTFPYIKISFLSH